MPVHCNSIEINGTFYSTQRPSSYRTWYKQTPEDFVFSVKCPRYVTHIRRLKEIEGPIANFFASGVLLLDDKLGPFLWQLPPSLPFDPERLAAFFELLPRDMSEAARVAKKHDKYLSDVWLKAARNRPLRHALEVRHSSFMTSEFVTLLRKYDIAVVVADTAGKWPLIQEVTSDFIYVRLHGDEELYVSGYTDEALRAWEKKLRTWHRGGNLAAPHRLIAPAPASVVGRDIFVYFDNDVKVRAPYDAMRLAHSLGIGPAPDEPPAIESIAEKPRAPSSWPWRNQRSANRASAGPCSLAACGSWRTGPFQKTQPLHAALSALLLSDRVGRPASILEPEQNLACSATAPYGSRECGLEYSCPS